MDTSRIDIKRPSTAAAELLEDRLSLNGLGDYRDNNELRALKSLKGVILMAGSVRRNPLQTATGRCVTDLPVTQAQRLIDCWGDQCLALSEMLETQAVPVRMLLNRNSPRPLKSDARSGIIISIEHDPLEFRGTGGVLRDICRGYLDDEYVLVLTAAQLMQRSLPLLACSLAAKEADAVIVSHADGSPSGAMLIRCGCLAALPDVGFVDLKEQGLSLIAKHGTVYVTQLDDPAGLPIRTLSEYIRALRRRHLSNGGRCKPVHAFSEDWEAAFRIVETGAHVGIDSRIHDSVVLAGATVGDRAVVVRSVVCSGAIVRRGQTVVDSIVTPMNAARTGHG